MSSFMSGYMSVSFGDSTRSRESYLQRKDDLNAWKRQDRENWRREHCAGYEKLRGLSIRKDHADWVDSPVSGRIDPPKNSGEGSYYVGH